MRRAAEASVLNVSHDGTYVDTQFLRLRHSEGVVGASVAVVVGASVVVLVAAVLPVVSLASEDEQAATRSASATRSTKNLERDFMATGV